MVRIIDAATMQALAAQAAASGAQSVKVPALGLKLALVDPVEGDEIDLLPPDADGAATLVVMNGGAPVERTITFVETT